MDLMGSIEDDDEGSGENLNEENADGNGEEGDDDTENDEDNSTAQLFSEESHILEFWQDVCALSLIHI